MRERQLSAAKWLGAIFMALIFVLFAAGAGDVRAAESGGQWVQEGDRWRYQLEDGSYVKGSREWPRRKYVNRRAYCFDADGYMMTGWIEYGASWFYADASGALLSGWQQIGGVWYYFSGSGYMEADTWVDGYYLNEDGAWVDSSEHGRWMQDANGWWYQYADGSYPAGTDVLIGGHYYRFDEHGYMITGWYHFVPYFGYEEWYYYNADGSNAEGWKLINNVWYYFGGAGRMWTDYWVGSCYLNQDGAWDPTANSRDIDNMEWNQDNIASGQWVQDACGWWYRYADGSYPASERVRINGVLYCFDENGYMCTGWYKFRYSDGYFEWCYADADGAVLYGWQQIGGLWYYFYNYGGMAESTYIDGYYLNGDGVWSAPTGYVE